MAFGIAIILLFLGWCMVRANEDPEEKAAREHQQMMLQHPCNAPKEYLLVYGIYAYYAQQNPPRRLAYRDAIRHARIEMLRLGYSPTYGVITHNFPFLSVQDEVCLNNTRDYEFSKCTTERIRKGMEKWAFPNAPHCFSWRYWAMQNASNRNKRSDYWYDSLFNRLTEWYYLVMFRDEYLSSGADIREALIPIVPGGTLWEPLYSEGEIDKAFADLLAEIQGIVACGDQWDAEIHAHQAQVAAQAQAEKQMREAPGEARRKRLLESGSLSSSGVDSGSSEWARQQLKEKYGIDYPEKQ